ncbi:response regulator transcription factor [Streptomyces sp. NPDC055210]
MIQLLGQLKQLGKMPATLVITEYISEIGVRHLLNLGASGILLQETAHLHLSWALPAALLGGCALSPEISKKVITEYTAPVIESTQKKAAQEKIYTLTARELEVLELLSQGLPNQTIANSLTISPGTVKDHVRSVFSKLNADNRLHAARIAWQAKKFDTLTRECK